METKNLKITSYQLDFWTHPDYDDIGEEGLINVKLVRCRQANGADKWAIRQWGQVLNKQGEWEEEPKWKPDRTAEFFARCRFDTVEEALAFWNEGHRNPLEYHREEYDPLHIREVWPPDWDYWPAGLLDFWPLDHFYRPLDLPAMERN